MTDSERYLLEIITENILNGLELNEQIEEVI